MKSRWLVLVAVVTGLGLTIGRCEVAPTEMGTRRDEVLKYLTDLPQRADHKVLSGQHAGDSQPAQNPFCARSGYAKYVEALRAREGLRVAVVGCAYDALGPNVQPLSNWRAVNEVVKEHWNQGGLVELGVAAHNPFTGGSANERRPQGRRLTELLTPGTEPNRRWMRQLDDVATALTELQAAGVVVLWRLFPEFNGDWFWWGAAADGQDYIALWRQTHDYLTTTRHLSNLIWVWAGSRESGPP